LTVCAVFFARLIAEGSAAMLLNSPAWQPTETLPVLYTRLGANLSPPLIWNHVPQGTSSLALICTDPDASRLWYHWLVWNIPASWAGLPQHLPTQPSFQNLSQGMTSYHTIGYDGPDPPQGQSHRYIFRLYALDRVLKLAPGVPGPQLERAMQGKVLAQAEFIGLFAKGVD
jgi:Raf kinase inhibitor-like YbhB/YbcL family protein